MKCDSNLPQNWPLYLAVLILRCRSRWPSRPYYPPRGPVPAWPLIWLQPPTIAAPAPSTWAACQLLNALIPAR